MQNKEKVQPFFDRAEIVNQRSDALISYVNELKARIMAASGGDYDEAGELNYSAFIGKDENGMDTVLNLKHVPIKDEYQNLTTFVGLAEPATPLEGEWTAVDLRTKMSSYAEYLRNISVTDN